MFKRLMFELFYRLGTPPWEGHPLPRRLIELIEGPHALPAATALDAGCGTGDAAIYLARHGWAVTAFDFTSAAVARARAKVQQAGVTVRVLQADVTRLARSDAGTGFQLIMDGGLLHGLDDAARDAYVREITRAAAPGATLLIGAFDEKDRRGPRGIGRQEIERRFGKEWEILGSTPEPAVSSRPDDPIVVYELRKR